MELQPNEPKTLELRSDQPLIGKNTYGDYYLYLVKNGTNEEMSFFAPTEKVHDQLKVLKKGDQFEITKTAVKEGKSLKVDYQVVVIDNKKEDKPNNGNDDFYYQAMEKSFSDAIRIQNKFNGMANVNQLAVTIYISRLKQNPSFYGG